MKLNLTRLTLGLIAVVLIDQLLYPNIVATIVSQISGIDSFFVWMVATELAFLFFATAVGGYIARTNFVVPAMLYAAADFAYGVYRGFTLATDSPQVSELDFSFLPLALLSLIFTLAVAAAGSVAGMKLFAVINSRRVELL